MFYSMHKQHLQVRHMGSVNTATCKIHFCIMYNTCTVLIFNINYLSKNKMQIILALEQTYKAFLSIL